MLDIIRICIIAYAPFVVSFKWTLNDKLYDKSSILTFSERHMFSTNDGPLVLDQGSSYIFLNNEVTIYTASNSTPRVAYAIFSPDEDHKHSNLIGMCEGDTYVNEWAALIDSKRIFANYGGKVNLLDPIRRINGTYHSWHTQIHRKYVVILEAWHNVAYQICPAQDSGFIFARINGEISFHNPYGYLPAELYGFLPFEGARMVAFFVFGLIFFVLYLRHRESAIGLHHAILAVLLLATVESAIWFMAYHMLNTSGQPYCCPFPSSVVAALVLQVFRQTFSRALLLIVCLGYGIVRPKLLSTEWIAVAVVTSLYLITAFISSIADIMLVHDVHGDAPKSAFAYEVPSLIMDIIFLTWIYLSLSSTIRILTEFQQTVKLNLYNQLALTIWVFVSLYGIVAVLIMLDNLNIVEWPWQWLWVQQVLWEILNFSVLGCVCIICRPSDHSKMLSYVSQLPTFDPDDDEDGEGGGGGGGWRPRTGPDSMDDDEEEEHGLKGGMDVSVRQGKSKSVTNSTNGSSGSPNNKNKVTPSVTSSGVSRSSGQKNAGGQTEDEFMSLPDADEFDHEYGLKDTGLEMSKF